MGKCENVNVRFNKRNFYGYSPGKLLFTWVDLIQKLILGGPDSKGKWDCVSFR